MADDPPVPIQAINPENQNNQHIWGDEVSAADPCSLIMTLRNTRNLLAHYKSQVEELTDRLQQAQDAKEDTIQQQRDQERYYLDIIEHQREQLRQAQSQVEELTDRLQLAQDAKEDTIQQQRDQERCYLDIIYQKREQLGQVQTTIEQLRVQLDESEATMQQQWAQSERDQHTVEQHKHQLKNYLLAIIQQYRDQAQQDQVSIQQQGHQLQEIMKKIDELKDEFKDCLEIIDLLKEQLGRLKEQNKLLKQRNETEKNEVPKPNGAKHGNRTSEINDKVIPDPEGKMDANGIPKIPDDQIPNDHNLQSQDTTDTIHIDGNNNSNEKEGGSNMSNLDKRVEKAVPHLKPPD